MFFITETPFESINILITLNVRFSSVSEVLVVRMSINASSMQNIKFCMFNIGR